MQCDLQFFTRDVELVDTSCCDDGVSCSGGVPTTCDAKCALRFLPFFDRCSAVLSALLGGASGEDGSRCEFLELEALLPRHLGVRQPFWLEAEEAETPRGRTPRGRTPRSRRSAAASGAAEGEGQGRLGQDMDAQLPYAHAG